MSHRRFKSRTCGMVGSVALFAFPFRSGNIFLSAYKPLIKGAVRKYRKNLAQSFQTQILLLIIELRFTINSGILFIITAWGKAFIDS